MTFNQGNVVGLRALSPTYDLRSEGVAKAPQEG